MQNSNQGTVANIRLRNGLPTIYINDQPATPIWYLPSAPDYVATEDVKEMRRAYRQGVRVFVVPYSPNDYADQVAFTERLKGDLLEKTALKEFPDAYIILRISCDIKAKDITEDLSEVIRLNETDQWEIASHASALWRERVKLMLSSIAQHVKDDPLLNKRVIGYELLGAACEWFDPGYWEGKMDTSEPNRLAFAEYLKRTYITKEGLQKAWDDNTVDFDTVSLPQYDKIPSVYNDKAHRNFVREGQTLLLCPKNRKYVDYLDYSNDLRAQLQIDFCKAIKETCDWEKLTITYFGYHADCYTSSSNHFATYKVLNSPYVDILSGPVAYQDRCEGGIGAYMGMADSVTASGKLWMDEGDYRSPQFVRPDGLPYPPTLPLLDQSISRELSKCMAHNTGVWWLSFNQGWFDYDDFWKNTKRLTSIFEAYSNIKRPSTPEVCFVLDERAMALAGDANSTGLQLIRFARTVCYRSGFQFGMYLIDDLLSGKIDDAKVYILVNPWRLNNEQIKTLANKLHRPGKTTLYLYGNGSTDAEDFHKLSGFKLIKHTLSDGYVAMMDIMDGLEPGIGDAIQAPDLPHGITQALVDLVNHELNPVYSVKSAEAVTILGQYRNEPVKGETGFARFEKDGWKSFFYGGMKISAELFEYVALSGGAHQFVKHGDVFDTDGTIAMLHVSDPGEKTIHFSQLCDIYLIEENRWLRDTQVHLKNTYRGQTVSMLYGNREKIELQIKCEEE